MSDSFLFTKVSMIDEYIVNSAYLNNISWVVTDIHRLVTIISMPHNLQTDKASWSRYMYQSKQSERIL